MRTVKHVKNIIRELVTEINNELDDELDESSATSAGESYNTPNAFSDGSEKAKKKIKKIATQVGYSVVNESIQLTDIVKLAKAQDKGNFDPSTIRSPFNVLTKTGIVKVKPVQYTTLNPKANRFDSETRFSVKGKVFTKLSGIVKLLGITENINERFERIIEGKKPKRKNRWLELKNDDSMHANKKLAVGLRNLRNQLHEVEKFLGWYNKLKNINELESDAYWKRTNTNIKKIKERIINIAKKLQEIEK